MSILSLKTISSAFAVGLISYCVYFDYQRRNNKEFRAEILRQRREAKKLQSTKVGEDVDEEEGPLPTTPEELQNYFNQNIIDGEQYLSQGPAMYQKAANAFYRALRVHPSPEMVLTRIHEGVPKEVFNLIVQKMQEAVKQQSEAESATIEEIE